VLFAHFGEIGIVWMRRKVVLDAPQSRPGTLFLGSTQSGNVAGFLDLVDARLEFHALLRQTVEIGRRHDGIGLRHALVVRLLARVEHVIVGRHIPAPAVQIAAHVVELAIILQPFLKLVAREERVQIPRFGGVRQRAELPIPGQGVLLVVVQQPVEQVSAADLLDRVVDMLDLRVEGIDSGVVIFGGLAGRGQLGVGVRDREKGLLNRRVEQAALAQVEPRHQRTLEFTHSRVRPAHAQQRLARVRSFQAHPLKNGFGLGGALRLQQRESKRQVRLVPERQQLFAARVDAAHAIEIRDGVGEPVLAHQRHP
jgi:hypothetical protein